MSNPTSSPSRSQRPAAETYRNYLFLAPETGAAEAAPDHEAILALARRLSGRGYVYVAKAGQPQMEDDPSGVRLLPLTPERLPSFGLLTAAFVVGDKKLAMAAAVEYDGSEVFLLKPTARGLRKRRVA